MNHDLNLKKINNLININTLEFNTIVKHLYREK